MIPEGMTFLRLEIFRDNRRKILNPAAIEFIFAAVLKEPFSDQIEFGLVISKGPLPAGIVESNLAV